MAIKITDQILSIPPYISTNWSRIASLHMKENTLVITLNDESSLNVPNLNAETVGLIFERHAAYLEKEHSSSTSRTLFKLKDIMEREDSSIRLAFGPSIDELGSIMQHNPNQANAPDLPVEILKKIEAIAKIVAPNEDWLLPKTEPGCNCFHCQIGRALNPINLFNSPEELEVTDEELKFEQWTITQTGEKLYAVANRLDENEKYNVYLGQPIGCTCGKQGCEHILAVLKS